MATVIKNLWVKNNTISLDGNLLPFWGYANSATSEPSLPAPLIKATVRDAVRVRLYNSIGEPVSILFPGQNDVQVRNYPGANIYHRVQPQYAGGQMISLTNYLDPSLTAGLEYIFIVTRPGIFLFESGTNPEKQVQMGMYGVIVVWPIGYNFPGHTNYRQAYGANTNSFSNVEKILVLGEIDTKLHNNAAYNVYYDMLNYKPDYWLVNGRTFPETLNNDDASTQPYGSQINCRVGEKVLLRIINAGFNTHTIFFGGLYGRVVAADSFPLKTPALNATYEKTGVTIAPGQSFDVIVTASSAGEFYLYDRELNNLVNIDRFPGGMMTKLKVSP